MVNHRDSAPAPAPLVIRRPLIQLRLWRNLQRLCFAYCGIFLFATAFFSLIFARTIGIDRLPDFNSYILRAVDAINQQYGGKGYDIESYFTHDLQYGNECCVPAINAPSTMCVAAVTEVMIEAINLFISETNEAHLIKALPLRSWTGRTRSDIRPYIFMFDGVKSSGTASALETFGVGRQIGFNRLLPGDFINLNRRHTGHAVVFMGFINRQYEIEDSYSERVAGFKYFSAQNEGRQYLANGDQVKYPAGFGYRWAFFDGFCPTPVQGKPRDCGVFLSVDQEILNTGYMLHPTYWMVENATRKIRLDIAETVRKRNSVVLGASLAYIAPSFGKGFRARHINQNVAGIERLISSELKAALRPSSLSHYE
jgi:hypothetical protein